MARSALPVLSYLVDDLIEVIYPEKFEHVRELMDDYRIDEYNNALEELNRQYDLEGFSKDMYFLERGISQ